MSVPHAHPALTPEEQRVVEAYHELYYRRRLWDTTTWLGGACLKSPHDVWASRETKLSSAQGRSNQ